MKIKLDKDFRFVGVNKVFVHTFIKLLLLHIINTMHMKSTEHAKMFGCWMEVNNIMIKIVKACNLYTKQSRIYRPFLSWTLYHNHPFHHIFPIRFPQSSNATNMHTIFEQKHDFERYLVLLLNLPLSMPQYLFFSSFNMWNLFYCFQ